MIHRYCAYCHNSQLKTGGLDLEKLDLTHLGPDAGEWEKQAWEKVVRKLRAGMMPPAGMPRPDIAAIDAFAESLEAGIDRAAAAKSKT